MRYRPAYPCLVAIAMTTMASSATGTEESKTPEVAVLELHEALSAALANHPAVGKAQAIAKAMQTQPDQVSAWDDPVVSVGTGIPFASPDDPPILEVKISQKIPLAPVLTYKKQEAEAMASVWATKIPAAELDVKQAVTRAYFDVVYLEQLRDVVVEQRDLAETILEAAMSRYASLASGQADVLRARIALDEKETEIEVIELEIASARETLVLLMGDGRDPVGFDVVAPVTPLLALDRSQLVALALSTRPELDTLDASALVLAAKKKVAKSGNVPWLTLTAGYQYKSDTLAGLMGQDAFALGLGMNIPLMQIKKNKAKQDEVDASIVANEAEKDELALAITVQVVVLFQEIEALEKKISLQQDKVVPEARLALELTLSAYATQSASITDVLAALETLLDSEQRIVQLRGRSLAELANLMRVVGIFEVPL